MALYHGAEQRRRINAMAAVAYQTHVAVRFCISGDSCNDLLCPIPPHIGPSRYARTTFHVIPTSFFNIAHTGQYFSSAMRTACSTFA